MKKILALSFAFALLIGMIGCEGGTSGKPTNFEIAANTDGDQVILTWEEPTEGTPDEYVVYFDDGGTGTFETLATVQTLTYTHDPAGATGDYKVAAKLGSDEFDSDVKSTIPVHTASTSLSELNAAGNSGYGWAITTDFGGDTYSMAQASNAASVDFYLTNFAAGYAGTYNIASPDQGPTDPGGVVPAGSWKVNGISDKITDLQAILPLHSTTTYFNYTALDTDPAAVAVYTADGYYALVNSSGYNTTNGTVNVETWFQSVKGLRLIAH